MMSAINPNKKRGGKERENRHTATDISKDRRTLRVAVCVVQCAAVWCGILQCGALCSSVLRCVAVRCSAQLCVAVCCSML